MGRRWHFFFAWLLVLNGLVYVVNLFVGRHLRDLVPTRADLQAIPRAILDHARLRFPKGDEALRYNVLQKLAYLSVVVAFPMLVLAGLTMSPAMDAAFPWLVPLFHGRQSARTIHFILATYLVAFVAVHIADGAGVGRRQEHALDDHRPLSHSGGNTMSRALSSAAVRSCAASRPAVCCRSAAAASIRAPRA